MRISGNFLRRPIAGCLVWLLAVPVGEAATALPSAQTVAATSAGAAQPGNSNNSTDVNPAPPKATVDAPGAASQAGSSSSAAPAQTDAQQQNPVGTAAAPSVKALGIPASRPAGAAIAPAKQKRARSFLIKIGIIVGAAIAVGAVVGLSKSSPSRPN